MDQVRKETQKGSSCSRWEPLKGVGQRVTVLRPSGAVSASYLIRVIQKLKKRPVDDEPAGLHGDLSMGDLKGVDYGWNEARRHQAGIAC